MRTYLPLLTTSVLLFFGLFSCQTNRSATAEGDELTAPTPAPTYDVPPPSAQPARTTSPAQRNPGATNVTDGSPIIPPPTPQGVQMPNPDTTRYGSPATDVDRANPRGNSPTKRNPSAPNTTDGTSRPQ